VKAGDFIWFPSNVDHDALAVEDCFAVEAFSPVRPEIFEPT
jgi:quercetin dioxygenase-like cupin family protein